MIGNHNIETDSITTIVRQCPYCQEIRVLKTDGSRPFETIRHAVSYIDHMTAHKEFKHNQSIEIRL